MLDGQQVEIVGRNWLTTELVHAGFEVATPIRDKGVDLLVSPSDYAWTLPIQLKTGRETVFQVHRKYVGMRLVVVYVLLGDKAQALPAESADAYRSKGNDYSARTFWLTPHEAWLLPAVSGKAQDLEGHAKYRFAWGPLLTSGLLDAKAALHRGQLRGVVLASRDRLTTEVEHAGSLDGGQPSSE